MLQMMNVAAGYGSHAVLKDASLRVERGALHVLLGRNGCGKSTLLKTIIRRIPLQSGQIYLNGQSIETISPRERARRLGYLPQTRSTTEMTVRELVECGRYPWLRGSKNLTGRDHEAVEKAMLQTGCLLLAERLMDTLSGGEQQRACLAMLLAQQAECLLLDEPTAHLDAEASFALMAMLKRLAHEGRGVLCVLHDLPLAMRYADRVTVFDEGRDVFSGTPDELASSDIPQQVFRVRLLLERETGVCYAAPLEE